MKGPSRLDRSRFARWWWSVDRVSLGLLGVIALVGFVLLLAAGPSAASRLGIGDGFHFPLRQLVFLAPALGAAVGVSLLSPLQARRLGALTLAGALSLLVFALLFAPEINGAKRWLTFGVLSLQPSEFLKPGFIIVAAWMLSEGVRTPSFPGALIAMALYFLCAFLLILQPDYGQAALLTAVWMVMFFIAGWGWLWIAVLSAVGTGAIAAGYIISPHVAQRIDGFFHPATAETYQVDKALLAIRNGGAFGRDEGAAAVKHQLPDAHTDFIFAVAAEEFGYFFCLFVIVLFALLVVRLYFNAVHLKSVFAQTAVCGLAAMIGLQALINIGVSMRALPAKGMTLPFVSYGGSSLLATGLALGLAFALTRKSGAVWRRKEMLA